jgi:hypothetical protein
MKEGEVIARGKARIIEGEPLTLEMNWEKLKLPKCSLTHLKTVFSLTFPKEFGELQKSIMNALGYEKAYASRANSTIKL